MLQNWSTADIVNILQFKPTHSISEKVCGGADGGGCGGDRMGSFCDSGDAGGGGGGGGDDKKVAVVEMIEGVGGA